jgi:hypothetical protein
MAARCQETVAPPWSTLGQLAETETQLGALMASMECLIWTYNTNGDIHEPTGKNRDTYFDESLSRQMVVKRRICAEIETLKASVAPIAVAAASTLAPRLVAPLAVAVATEVSSSVYSAHVPTHTVAVAAASTLAQRLVAQVAAAPRVAVATEVPGVSPTPVSAMGRVCEDDTDDEEDGMASLSRPLKKTKVDLIGPLKATIHEREEVYRLGTAPPGFPPAMSVDALMEKFSMNRGTILEFLNDAQRLKRIEEDFMVSEMYHRVGLSVKDIMEKKTRSQKVVENIIDPHSMNKLHDTIVLLWQEDLRKRKRGELEKGMNGIPDSRGMSVQALQDELRDRCMDTNGTKSTMADRLDIGRVSARRYADEMARDRANQLEAHQRR